MTAGSLIGIDVGGTFTDVVCVDSSGTMAVGKTPSRPDTPGADVIEGIRAVALILGKKSELELLRETTLIVHGSTVATNLLLTLSGNPVGMVTTRGFRDIVEMRGGVRESTFDVKMKNATPLAPRHLRLEVLEQVTTEGEVREPVDVAALEPLLGRLRAAEVEGLAVVLKHAYANSANELAITKYLETAWPEVFVTASSEISNRVRLYERGSTTVVNAYVGPKTRAYIERLLGRLGDLGFAGQLLIMGGHGGVMAPEEAARSGAKLLLSGPAAGPVGAGRSLQNAQRDALFIDMGGTSFDVSVLENGRVPITSRKDINRYRVAVPMSDIHTVGAGGGSLAWIDGSGLLQVGPESAGARPGPACYGLGGSRPTVTDANLVLGYLSPNMRLGGKHQLHLELASAAIGHHVGSALGMDTADAALGIHRVATEFMAVAVRETTVGKGVDPAQLPLVVGGGAAGLHAIEIAEALGIREVIFPLHGGVMCALGMLAGKVRYDHDLSVISPLRHVDGSVMRARLTHAEIDLRSRLAAVESSVGEVEASIEVDARYEGQFHEISVAVDEDWLTNDHDSLRKAFHDAHLATYGFAVNDADVELVNVRVTAEAALRSRYVQNSPWRWDVGSEREMFLDSQWHRVPTYRTVEKRSKRAPSSLEGPAALDLMTSTILIPPGWICDQNERCDIVVTRRVIDASTSASASTSARRVTSPS